MYVVLGLLLAKLFARITLIPDAMLWPGVLVFAVIGAYGQNQSHGRRVGHAVFGVVGLFFRRFGFSPAPLVMGLVLGKMVEETLKQSLFIFDQNWLLFFSRPIVVALFVVTALSISMPFIARFVRHVRRRPADLNPIEE